MFSHWRPVIVPLLGDCMPERCRRSLQYRLWAVRWVVHTDKSLPFPHSFCRCSVSCISSCFDLTDDWCLQRGSLSTLASSSFSYRWVLHIYHVGVVHLPCTSGQKTCHVGHRRCCASDAVAVYVDTEVPVPAFCISRK